MTARPTISRVEAADASCLHCGWSVKSSNALGLAAQHHDRTGHPIRTVITRAVTYGSTAAAPDGQESLLDQLETKT